MSKKILFIIFLSITLLGFSQEKTIDNVFAAPNPFTNSTTINFTASNISTVNFSVRNVLGKTVLKKNIWVTFGKNTIAFYKNDLPSGIYIYSIQDKKKIISKRFIIK
ncbi:T9SS type A sorting domain-containing protein [uncultured Polaribacter sp.]|uniref:T9SS type A sorting domain-containing protein n=1 Tax=uncultured Polaribacter sp. TaxID=174711 RepID=UPI002628FB06|nr:T9SS type A sorting domain-containing protein [uncultured Polaribacter sp.]